MPARPDALRLPGSPVKLPTRLAVVTAGTVFLASAIAGALLLRMERGQLLADQLAGSRVLVRSLQVSVENALRDGQDPDIAELLGRLELVAHQVDVFVFAPGAEEPRLASLGGEGHAAGVQQVRALTLEREEVFEFLDVGQDVPRLVAGVPLRTDAGERIGTLVVHRPLVELQADIRTTTLLLGVSVVTFALTTTLVMLVLLRREVTRPLSRIVAATEELGGDLDAHLTLPEERSEELEAVRDTLLGLQRQLVAARDARAAEVQQREQLERQLRDADKLIVVGQLAAGVAHEVGSPLQVLVGRARLLAHDPAQNDEVHRQARLIEEHASRIAAIVERLQDVVRRRPSRLTEVDLGEPVRKVMWLLEPEARRRRVALTWEVPEGPCPVRADPDEVQQVVLNLTLNALQACDPGRAVRVRVQATTEGGELRVEDAGRGMDAPTRARVFEPFFTTRAEGGGTGLGLAVVRSIVDRHRARIEVDSVDAEGTTVRVHWPRGSS